MVSHPFHKLREMDGAQSFFPISKGHWDSATNHPEAKAPLPHLNAMSFPKAHESESPAIPASSGPDHPPVHFGFANTYARLPERFFARLDPTPVDAPLRHPRRTRVTLPCVARPLPARQAAEARRSPMPTRPTV